jgi:hypothetical protein
MKQVMINQCDFCKKVSFHKSNLRQHEKICFFNPITRSCATCFWCSMHFEMWPAECFKGEFKFEIAENTTRPKLKTQCKKWMDAELIEDIDIYDILENKDGVLDKLKSGQKKYFKTRQVVNEKDSMRKSFSMEVLDSPDPVIKLFKEFVSEPKF